MFDARFLRNPHYDPMLRPRTGLDPAVGEYIRADQDYAAYTSRITDLVDLVLPRFVHEGKKYATIAIGCTGGRHRSVYLIERLAAHLSSRLAAIRAAGESGLDWRQTVTHRELNLGELSLDELRQFGSEFGEDFYAAVTLEATLDCHDVMGGTATHHVKAAIREAALRVAAMKKASAPEVIHAGA